MSHAVIRLRWHQLDNDRSKSSHSMGMTKHAPITLAEFTRQLQLAVRDEANMAVPEEANTFTPSQQPTAEDSHASTVVLAMSMAGFVVNAK
jgi:hypothetical protein